MRKKEKQKEESTGISNAKPKRRRNSKRKRSSDSKRKRNSNSTFFDSKRKRNSNSTFFACYLLHSLRPGSVASYIGFTVNPHRRLKEHNGKISHGASQTKKKRPWEMILCVYGFPSEVSALQFEWAWRHPTRSVALKKAAACIEPSLNGIARRIKLVYTMLTHPKWESLNLTVNFMSTEHIKHTKDCFPLPPQMQVRICSLDELPCYTDTQLSDNKDDIARGEHSSTKSATTDPE